MWNRALFLLSIFCIPTLNAKVSMDELFRYENKLRGRKDTRVQWLDLYRRRSGFDHFSIVDPQTMAYPELRIIPIGVTEEDFSCCIITYASMDRNQQGEAEEKIQRMKESLEKVGYKGHLLYRIGGWPNMEKGCLSHCHVPYGFKACAFMEALRLGYTKAIWLDHSVVALRPITSVFQEIEEKESVYSLAHLTLEYCANDLFLKSMYLFRDELPNIPHVNACIVGFHLKNPKVQSFIEAWHASVESENAYFSWFPEQLPLSVLMQRHALIHSPCSKLLASFQDKDNVEECFFRNIRRSVFQSPKEAKEIRAD